MSFAAALVLLILPKCPYCFVAYSSAITICGLPAHKDNSMEILILALLVAVIIGSLLFSYRGRRTWVALLLVALGTVLMAYGTLNETLNWYHLGSMVLLAGTLANRRIFKLPFTTPAT